MNRTASPLAPVESRPLVSEAGTSLELFSGGGGLAIAMHRAGFRHLLLNEHNHRACATLRENQAVDYDADDPDPISLDDRWPLVEGDIHKIDFARWNGQVDVVAGGVPCQPFSLGGAHRGHLDERNLWPELLRAVRETHPRVILAENVKGLLRPSFRPYWEYIVRAIGSPFAERSDGEDWQDHDRRLTHLTTSSGDLSASYDVHYKIVNAADYGIPQIRWRVFIVAFRKDLQVDWAFPDPTHSEAGLIRAKLDGRYWADHYIENPATWSPDTLPVSEGTERWRTVRDVISDLPEPVLRQETPPYLHHIGWPGARIYKGHEPNNLDRPAKTVKAGVHGVPGGESVLRLDDGSIRYLTVRETARIMTFPDRWKLVGPRGEQMRQLGNAVPVELGEIMAKAIGRAIRPSLRATRP